MLQAYLTAAREESVPRAHEMVEAIEKRMLVGLNPEKRLQLLNGLRSCTDSLEVKAEKIAADAAGE